MPSDDHCKIPATALRAMSRYPLTARRVITHTLLMMVAALGRATADEPTKPACELSANGTQVEVSSLPDDSDWGPTIEIKVSDTVQVLNRLLVVEDRPIEVCGWVDLPQGGPRALVIALGPALPKSAGVRVYKMVAGTLEALPVAPLGNPGTYRYLVVNGALHAFSTNAATPAVGDMRYDFNQKEWRESPRE